MLNEEKYCKMQTMDQFSHDLTLALEETSRIGGVRVRWGARRRTRSTGNLPCAPQPTEDSSSSPTDAPNDIQNNQNQDGLTNSMLSDSDDRHDLRLSLKSRHAGNFESDSLNENFSPARFFRPNTRRKRKFKRMAVEYETTPSTAGAAGAAGGNNPNAAFPMSGTVKKRVLKHTTQENFRTNLFFCGKRKRSHRDRYHVNDHGGKQHSSSVPRQRDIFTPKNSYQEHKTRTRSFSAATKPSCERILPLNKSIVSKIEKISQQQKKSSDSPTITTTASTVFSFAPVNLMRTEIPAVNNNSTTVEGLVNRVPLPDKDKFQEDVTQKHEPKIREHSTLLNQTIPENAAVRHHHHPQKSGSFESTFAPVPIGGVNCIAVAASSTLMNKKPLPTNMEMKTAVLRRKHKHNRIRRGQLRAQLQFDDPNSMECGGLNEFLSSSSLSSSDSEAAETNESDREGDDELTDWPGNEVMINFASKNDFKRKSTKKSTNLPLIKSDDYAARGGDDDTLMSGDEVVSPPGSGGVNFPLPLSSKPLQSQPIAIIGTGISDNSSVVVLEDDGGMSPTSRRHYYYHHHHDQFRFPVKQIESEMSGETSNHFLSSPPEQPGEIREIRAGCRRIREERRGFSIVTSVNERLSKFLQDARQAEIRLPDFEIHEHDSLMDLAKLYSLQMSLDNGCAVLSKTSNTTQSVKIDQQNFGNPFFFNDCKRRCYDGRSGSIGSCSQETNESLIDSQADYCDEDVDDNRHQLRAANYEGTKSTRLGGSRGDCDRDNAATKTTAAAVDSCGGMTS